MHPRTAIRSARRDGKDTGMAGSLHHPHLHPGSGEPPKPDDLYAELPPWDIGRPQSAFLALAEAGAIRGRVLDAGCGTGEHVLMCVGLGLDATSVDLASRALRTAGGRLTSGVARRAVLRAEKLIKAAVIHERLATEYGFTGTTSGPSLTWLPCAVAVAVPRCAYRWT